MMLSRTADHLFWMARYTERAENTARMLDVNYQMSLLPQSRTQARQGWEGLLSISELTQAYESLYGEVTAQGVMTFMTLDEANPSSIISCLKSARENARAVRGSLTTEVWETQNQTWLEMRRLIQEGQFAQDPSQLFEWVKFRSHLSRGVSVGTMLMDESLHFLRLGTFLERADNTARLLDVKFHAAQDQLSDNSQPGVVEYDFYYWSAILRSVSGFEIYRKVYRNVILPEKVVELLVLRSDMPRSLHACLNDVVNNLTLLAEHRASESLRRASKLRAQLQYAHVDEIFSMGLHTYLVQFLDRINDIGRCVSREFMQPG
jgi:uncharacterized alpha-E superfamily protein